MAQFKCIAFLITYIWLSKCDVISSCSDTCTCATGEACTIDCTSESCDNALIHSGSATSISIDCEGQRSCENSEFHIGNVPLIGTVTCSGYEACMSAKFYIGNHSSAVTLTCNNDDDACFYAEIYVESASEVTINCDGTGSDSNRWVCDDANINCGATSSCTIHCNGDRACKALHLHCDTASECTVRCDYGHQYSCQDWYEFDCGTSVCSMYCDDSFSACSNGEDISPITTDAVSFQCVGSGCDSKYTNAFFSASPSNHPTHNPSATPSSFPTRIPTLFPSMMPSVAPTNVPTNIPTMLPSNIPSETPTETPTDTPTNMPTNIPSLSPSLIPSETPTEIPTGLPSNFPTEVSSNIPTNTPVENGQHVEIATTIHSLETVKDLSRNKHGLFLYLVVSIGIIVCLSLTFCLCVALKRKRQNRNIQTKHLESMGNNSIKSVSMEQIINNGNEVSNNITNIVKVDSNEVVMDGETDSDNNDIMDHIETIGNVTNNKDNINVNSSEELIIEGDEDIDILNHVETIGNTAGNLEDGEFIIHGDDKDIVTAGYS